MDQLIIDLLLLDSIAIDVGRIQSEFSGATARTERLGDAVGHPGLAQKVESFASNWDMRRGELVEQLDTVHTHLETIIEGFRTTDTELAKALTEQASTYPPRTAAPQQVK